MNYENLAKQHFAMTPMALIGKTRMRINSAPAADIADDTDEQSLLRRAYIMFFPVLCAFLAKKTKNREIARELAQDAFIRLSNAGVPSDSREAKSLLMTIAENLARNHHRDNGRRNILFRNNEPLLKQEIDDVPTPEDHALSRENLSAFAEAVRSLPKRQRQAVLLSRISGMSNAEIAAKMNISPETVRRHVYDGLRRCHSAIESDHKLTSDTQKDTSQAILQGLTAWK